MRATMESSDPKGRTTMATVRRPTHDRAGYPPPALTALVLALFAVALAVCAVVMIGESSSRARDDIGARRRHACDDGVELP